MARTVTIRRSLLTNLILVITVLGLGIIVMMALSTRRAIENLSGSLIRQASQRTEVRVLYMSGYAGGEDIDALMKKARNADVEIVTVVRKLDGQKRLQVEAVNPVS